MKFKTEKFCQTMTLRIIKNILNYYGESLL